MTSSVSGFANFAGPSGSPRAPWLSRQDCPDRQSQTWSAAHRAFHFETSGRSPKRSIARWWKSCRRWMRSFRKASHDVAPSRPVCPRDLDAVLASDPGVGTLRTDRLRRNPPRRWRFVDALQTWKDRAPAFTEYRPQAAHSPEVPDRSTQAQ